MSECTDTTTELVEEMRRIGNLGHWPTYHFAGSLFWVADRLESQAKRIEELEANCNDLSDGALRSDIQCPYALVDSQNTTIAELKRDCLNARNESTQLHATLKQGSEELKRICDRDADTANRLGADNAALREKVEE